MATSAPARQFIDGVIADIIEPGVERLLESRYFADLRAGKLTKRRMQGFAIQHYRHNMGILKAAALGAVQAAATNDLFRVYGGIMYEEWTHPQMCKRFGFALGLTDADFENALPTFGCLAHTAACLHDMYLATPPELLANALTNETMVQRYASEFDAHLRSYGIPEDAMEFFVVHKGADIEHTERSANMLAELASTDDARRRVAAVCRNMTRFKLGKFESIYDDYADE